ncbi:MAG: ankyrin repeat domain-containing protein [Marinifilaceae bacterium]
MNRYFRNGGLKMILNTKDARRKAHDMMKSGSPDITKKTLNLDNINHQTIEGVTPLLLAILLDKYEIANYLIKNGADIHIPDECMNFPIHVASNAGNIELVSLLIKEGVNLFSKTRKGNIPIALAANNEHHDIVKLLFKNMY